MYDGDHSCDAMCRSPLRPCHVCVDVRDAAGSGSIMAGSGMVAVAELAVDGARGRIRRLRPNAVRREPVFVIARGPRRQPGQVHEAVGAAASSEETE